MRSLLSDDWYRDMRALDAHDWLILFHSVSYCGRPIQNKSMRKNEFGVAGNARRVEYK